MNDLKIRDLLHEVADDVEPGDRLAAIRAATAPAGRRTRRGWWAAGGAGLVAASVVTAFTLNTGGAPQTTDPDLAGPPSTSDTATDEDGTSRPVAVYFVGDTALGPRLFRELRPDIDADSRVLLAIHAALGGDALDPDYRSPWPEGVVLRQWSDRPDGITVSLEGAPVDRPAGLSEEEARLAIEQLVRTAQAVAGRGKVPVDVQIERQVTDTVLGVPTTAPLKGSPDLEVLAPVSLSEPSEGQTMRANGTLWVSGRATSADDLVTVRVQRWEGTAVALGPSSMTLDEASGSPGSFSLGLRSDDLQPGEYEVIAKVQNSDGTTDTDTRRITIVD
jgi:hypothetical protein